MKILFLYPETENLGVEYLSACLKKNNHQVELIFDPMLFATYFLKISWLEKTFDYKNLILRKIKASQPELICFSVFSDHYGWACGLAESIRKVSAAPIVFGGIHPTSAPETVLNNSFVDYVCVGEGEEALVELADALENKKDASAIPNIWAKRDGHMIKNPVRRLFQDLDEIPFPDKELFKEQYPGFSGQVYTIITARGCVNACTYCYNSALRDIYKDKGPYLRRRSPGNVLDELRRARSKWDIQRVSFFDDLFIYDKKWLEEFLPLYRRDIGKPYFCHIHPSFVDPELVRLLESSGCTSVTMGIQTFNEPIRKTLLHRYESNQTIINAINAFKASRIFLFTNIILGLPKQDAGVLEEDLLCANRHKADMIATNWLRYYPGVELLSLSKGLDLINDKDIDALEAQKKYLPYSIKGNTYNKTGAKMRNLFSLCQLIPQSGMKFIVRHKWYRFLPEFNLRFVITLFVFLHRKFALRKHYPFAYLGPKDTLDFYYFFSLKRICSFPESSRGKRRTL